jgi:hypothetical protein
VNLLKIFFKVFLFILVSANLFAKAISFQGDRLEKAIRASNLEKVKEILAQFKQSNISSNFSNYKRLAKEMVNYRLTMQMLSKMGHYSSTQRVIGKVLKVFGVLFLGVSITLLLATQEYEIEDKSSYGILFSLGSIASGFVLSGFDFKARKIKDKYQKALEIQQKLIALSV